MHHTNKRLIIAALLIYSLVLFSCSDPYQSGHNPTVEIKYQDGKAQLFRHGEPYFIKGAAGTEHLEKVAEYGGNSIRTWSLYDVERILDEAHELGLTVTIGLEIGRPYWGNDFNYWKFWEVDRKIEELRPIIEKFKDHPALLMWGVGNEIDRYGGGIRLLIYYTINKVAKMVKEIDPNHPTMTAISALSKKKLKTYTFSRHIMPNIDIIGINAFNAIENMHERIYGQKGWDKAYIFSEWGPSGHWEISHNDWGAPRELKNSEKRDLMKKNWDILKNDTALFVGSYAFYWGFKHEATHTWFSLFSEEGFETSSVNFLKYAWSGEQAKNMAPNIDSLFIETMNGLEYDNVYLENSMEFSAIAYANDPERDSLTYKWEIRPEENYFLDEIIKTDVKLAYYNMEYLIQKVEGNKIQFTTPKEEGPYRIFVFAYDGNGNVASYNVPFYVIVK